MKGREFGDVASGERRDLGTQDASDKCSKREEKDDVGQRSKGHPQGHKIDSVERESVKGKWSAAKSMREAVPVLDINQPGRIQERRRYVLRLNLQSLLQLLKGFGNQRTPSTPRKVRRVSRTCNLQSR